jgi:competence protein ComEC
MRLTFLAIGQGDAALVQLPSGHAILVDAGGDLRSFPSDRAGREVLSTLAELGVSRLDLLVLTHPHPDHAGGIPAVLEKLSVDELWMPATHDPISDAIARKARERGVPVREPRTIELAGVRLEVLSRPWDEGRSANDNSIVVRLVHGQVRVLLAGDVEALSELELAQAPVAAQLLKAGHHGSRTSSTDAFLRAVRPAHVVYSVGAHNSFGFPHEDVVERTRALGARTFRTDQGAVLARSDGRTLVVRQWPEAP